ncbi:MAG: sugar ABC transporter permease [Lachnospiraceae bacterium]|nr:sugar ABC transporter permease [Lachnospiraceae bacterium]
MKKASVEKLKLFMIFVAPTLFIFITVVLFPLLYGVFLSLTDWNGVSTNFNLIGLSNYAKVFTDSSFWNSFLMTLKYVIISVVLVNGIGFMLAYLLTSGVAGEKVLRTGFFTSNLLGGIVLGFVWSFIFQRALVYIGQNLNWKIFSESWLADPEKAFWTLVIVTVWQLSGYMMIIYIAGFMSIPQDVLEAAAIDGCNATQSVFRIILPLMVPSFVICVFLTLQRCFMVYDINLSLTKGGPYNSTVLIAMHVYQKAFLSHQYGVGQAEAFILFIMVAAISGLQLYFSKKLEVES